MRTRRTATLTLAGCLALAALGGCGDDEPSYCSDRSDLEESVQGLRDVRPTESGAIDRIRSQVGEVQTDASALVDSAQADFPDETGELRTSVDALEQSVQAVPESPSREQVVAVGADVTAVVSAADGLVDATRSECE